VTQTQRFLTVYSAVLTLALAVILLAAASPPKSMVLDQLTVRRINVVEPDGTLRMVISDHASLPGIVVRGKERPFARPQAGILFYNDEASEIGGLIFGGRRDAKGAIRDAGGSLSFDRYEANQIVQLLGVDDAEDKLAGLLVLDSPSGAEVHRRIWLGRGEDGTATLALLDGQGRKRLLLQVAQDGTTTITALDAEGKVARDLLAASGSGS
jgi:hypothetical protein